VRGDSVRSGGEWWKRRRQMRMSIPTPFTFLEFFAGGGLARMGLGPDWSCLFANDISEKKARVYRANYPPAEELLLSDIARVTPDDVQGSATLAWASFPCQDLSLAGNGKGLQAERSGAFWPFWSLLNALDYQGRPVPIVVLENVVGLLTSNEGKDLEQLLICPAVPPAAFYCCGKARLSYPERNNSGHGKRQ
jgi:DNA (cytosine-5)-methyltransferase 1